MISIHGKWSTFTFDVFIYDVYSLSLPVCVCVGFRLCGLLIVMFTSRCYCCFSFSLYNYNSQNHNSAWHYRISCYFIVSLPFFLLHFCFLFAVVSALTLASKSLYLIILMCLIVCLKVHRLSIQFEAGRLVHRHFRIDFRGEMFQLFPKNEWHFQRKLLLFILNAAASKQYQENQVKQNNWPIIDSRGDRSLDSSLNYWHHIQAMRLFLWKWASYNCLDIRRRRSYPVFSPSHSELLYHGVHNLNAIWLRFFITIACIKRFN